MPPACPVDPAEVRRVVALDDAPVIRNLLITQRYHDLSEALRLRTGGDFVNWCTFGTWASKTAGSFIRSEEVPQAFRRVLDRGNVFGEIAHLLDPAGLLDVVSEIVSDASAFLMMGNLVVFSELAGTVAAFVVTCGDDDSPDLDKLRRFQATLSEGEPLPDAVAWDGDRRRLIVTRRGGQSLLREMVGNYYAAMFERDRKKRAELLLLANAQGGMHEQTRLQTYIERSLDVAVDDTLLRHAHDRVVNQWGHDDRLTGVAHALVDRVVRSAASRIRGAWEDFATLTMMQLVLPDGAIHLGRPIPSEPGAPPYPPELESIENPELRQVLQQFNALDVPVATSLRERALERFSELLGCGHPLTEHVINAAAVDWASYPQRMRFIFTLFRSRGCDPHLVAAPFTPEQVAAITTMRVPAGPL
jgi:hypothetical protein